jgi:hypothetical protein
MLFLNAFIVGFAVTLGVEVALGLCYAVKVVKRGNKK